MKQKTGIGLVAAIAAALLIAPILFDGGGDPDQGEARPEAPAQRAEFERFDLSPSDPSAGSDARTALVGNPIEEPAAEPDPPFATPSPAGHRNDGCLTLTARRAGLPLVDGPAWVIATDQRFLPRDLGELDLELTRLRLDAAGQAHLCALEPGTHLVGVEPVPGVVFSKLVEVSEGACSSESFDFGGASLFGVIHGPTGDPAEGARVQISGIQNRTSVVVWSNALGEYSVDGLGPGQHWFSVDFDGDRWGDSDHMSQPVLEEGEQRRLDVGRPEGLAVFSGVLRDRAGRPVEGFGRSQPKLYIERVDARDYTPVDVEEEGRFASPLEEGRYTIHATVDSHVARLLVTERLDVGVDDLQRDLTLPGTTIRGRLLGASSAAETGARAHLVGHTYSAAFHRAVADENGGFAIHGLGPGVWRVGPFGAALEEFLELEVRAEDLELTVDLELP